MINTKIKFRPILFSTPMVQAILDGNKSQTRRIVKYPLKSKTHLISIGECEHAPPIEFSPYEVGDVLWVREKFAPKEMNDEPPGDKVHYYASDPFAVDKWKPSIFMPKEACRIFLEITKVRIERLRNIFHSDARLEGVDFIDGASKPLYYNYLTMEYGCNELYSFMTLWQSINGLDSWDKNPFVWVIEFKRIEKPLDFNV